MANIGAILKIVALVGTAASSLVEAGSSANEAKKEINNLKKKEK